jgi:hypothetical protein
MKAYLIGNGCSIPYGSPLGSDIFKRAFELFYEGWKYYHDNRYHRLKNYLIEIIHTMDDLRNQVAWGNQNSLHMGEFSKEFEVLINHKTSYVRKMQAYRKIESDLANYRIWELFPEIVKYYNDNELHGLGTLKRKRSTLLGEKGNFFDKVADFSFKTIYFAIKHSDCNPDYYTNFVNAISSSFEDTVIINLNYDNLLEKALKDNFKGIREFAFGDKIRCFPYSQFGENTGKKVLLFKPHGSFDFLFCETCNSITISEDVPLENSLRSTPEKQCKNSNCNKRNLHSFFIPYTYVNCLPIRYKDILKSILEKMKKVLDSVNEITAIGYSFSKDNGELIDNHLKFIFENRKVIVVAKDILENKKICCRLKPFGIEAEDSGFNGFADFIRHMPSNFFTGE